MTAPGVLFEFDGVVVERAGSRILDGVTVTIRCDGIVVLAGASGSGKSTLLRLCNRLVIADQGVVSFRGRDVMELDPLGLRRQVGMVFQRPTVFPGTVMDNLSVARPGIDVETAVEELARVGLPPEMLDRVADTLSGGEAQRVCLARTMVTGPEIVLMDEVTSSLDRTATLGLEALATDLSARGVAVIWVTHDLGQLRRLADHVIVLDHGRVVASGIRVEVERVDHPAVRALATETEDEE